MLCLRGHPRSCRTWPRQLCPRSGLTRRLDSHTSIACKAERSNSSPDPEEAQEEIVLSNWNLPEFWEGLTWEAAVPATCAVAMSWVLTDSFITSKLPEGQDAACMLIWLLPCVLLDALVWAVQPHNLDDPALSRGHACEPQARGGLALYRQQRRAACAAKERALPPVQKNVLLLLQTSAQQFAIQGVLSVAAVRLLQEADHEFPGVLPHLPGLPGLAHVDPALVAAAACMGTMVCMVSYRVRRSAHAFHPDHLERSTAAFVASLGERPVADASSVVAGLRRSSSSRAPPQAGRAAAKQHSHEVQEGYSVAVALAAVRQALLVTCCTMVFLQTDSILASVWVAYIAANAERRLSSLPAWRS